RRDLPDLIDVVALLPAPHLSPRDLRRRVERIERFRRDAAPAELMRRDAEVAELELLVLADEHVERREVAVKGLTAMQGVERLQNRGDLAANEALGLRSLASEPRAEVAVLRILHRETVSHARPLALGEAVEDAQRARLTREQLGEVCLAEPRGEAVADL